MNRWYFVFRPGAPGRRAGRSIFMKRSSILSLCAVVLSAASLCADAPVGMYLFPAGGQRGRTVDLLVGGLNLNQSCNFEIVGPGVAGPNSIKRTAGPFFEGPVLPLPESQRQEDYPRTLAAQIKIAADAPLGNRFAFMWTAQGVTNPLTFVVGELPELVEKEIDGAPIPVLVEAPITINGRIYPRENVDAWKVRLKKGQALTCSVAAASIGSPLDARLVVYEPGGRKIAESRDGLRSDPRLRFVAAQDGDYQIHITDSRSDGGPAFVYRLTLTTGPAVDRVFPLGGRGGEKIKLKLFGHDVPVEPVEFAIPATAGTQFKARWHGSNEFRLDVDNLPEAFEDAAKSFEGSFVGNGAIAQPGEIDVWNLNAAKGDSFDVDLRAFRLGSPLLGVLTLRDPVGKVLSTAEAGPNGDPSVRLTATTAGKYTIEVQDRFRSRGGPNFAYRLRVERSQSDFDLQMSLASLTISRGEQPARRPPALRITANRRGNLSGPIFLRLDGLPAGVTLAKEAVILASQTSVDLSFKIDATARIQSFPMRISGFTLPPFLSYATQPLLISRTASFRQGDDELDHVRVAIALPTPFKIAGDYLTQLVPRGTVYTRKFRVERNGFAGPIEVDMADNQARHLQGVTGSVITVPAGVDEFEYAVRLPSWMETGRTCRVCVMGTAIVKDADGSEHVVTYSSREQNDQIITVIEPERLSLQLERSSLRIEPGKEVEIDFKVSRAEGLNAPVQIEAVLPAHFRGIQIAPTEVPAAGTSGKLKVRFAADAKGPFNMPLVVRGVAKDGKNPVTAEAKIELVGVGDK